MFKLLCHNIQASFIYNCNRLNILQTSITNLLQKFHFNLMKTKILLNFEGFYQALLLFIKFIIKGSADGVIRKLHTTNFLYAFSKWNHVRKRTLVVVGD